MVEEDCYGANSLGIRGGVFNGKMDRTHPLIGSQTDMKRHRDPIALANGLVGTLTGVRGAWGWRLGLVVGRGRGRVRKRFNVLFGRVGKFEINEHIEL